jgi:hypothetical protein
VRLVVLLVQLVMPLTLSVKKSLLLDNGFVNFLNMTFFVIWFLFSRLLKKLRKSVLRLFIPLRKPFILHKKLYRSNIIYKIIFSLFHIACSSFFSLAGLATEAQAKGRFLKEIRQRNIFLCLII